MNKIKTNQMQEPWRPRSFSIVAIPLPFFATAILFAVFLVVLICGTMIGSYF